MNKETDQAYDALWEDYEDAMMRLIMYRVAQEDGNRLLAEMEELERSGFEVPKELDAKCLKLIRDSAYGEQNQPQHLQGTGARESKPARHFRLRKMGEILAAAILAAALLFCVAYAADAQFRENVLSFFVELRENGTQFFFSSTTTGSGGPKLSNAPSTEEDFPFKFTYIPEGYELFAQKNNEYRVSLDFVNPNYENHIFYFQIDAITDDMGLLVDTEDADITNVNICGYEGWLIQKCDPYVEKEKIMYHWFDLKNGYSFLYSSLGISLEETQKIFDGIVIYEQRLKSP